MVRCHASMTANEIRQRDGQGDTKKDGASAFPLGCARHAKTMRTRENMPVYITLTRSSDLRFCGRLLVGSQRVSTEGIKSYQSFVMTTALGHLDSEIAPRRLLTKSWREDFSESPLTLSTNAGVRLPCRAPAISHDSREMVLQFHLKGRSRSVAGGSGSLHLSAGNFSQLSRIGYRERPRSGQDSSSCHSGAGTFLTKGTP